MPPLLVNKSDSEKLSGKYVFIDNDFLKTLFGSSEIFKSFLDFTSTATILVDPLTIFEFMRDTFDPGKIILQNKFLFDTGIFIEASDHQEIYKNLKNNALILSRIYSYQNTLAKKKQDKSKAGSPSVVDLMVAARLMQ